AFGVKKDGRDDLHRSKAARHRGVQCLTHAPPAAGDKRKRDRATTGVTRVARRHVAKHLQRDWRIWVGDKLRALVENKSWISRCQPHELLAIRQKHVR